MAMSESSESWQQHPGAEAAPAAAAPPYNTEYVGIPGVRFVPSDQELINDYLVPKIHGQKPLDDKLVHVADVYAEHPKDLTKRLGKSTEGFWYVFSMRNRKYPKGKRPRRSTVDAGGRWKAVGKNMPILSGADDKTIIGRKCALAYELFVRDHPLSRPRMEKTEWKMCEFVAGDTDKPISESENPDHMLLNDCVLCRITRKGAAGQEAVLEDDGQAAVVDEPDEDKQVQGALLPPDPSQLTRAQVTPVAYLLHEGADDGWDGIAVGNEGGHDDLEPLPRDGDDGGATDAQWEYHPEHCWGDGYGVAYDHDPWNQIGAPADPEVMSQFQEPADPIELPSDPQSWDIVSTLLFSDDGHELVENENVRANDDDTGEDDAAANETPGPADADSQD